MISIVSIQAYSKSFKQKALELLGYCISEPTLNFQLEIGGIGLYQYLKLRDLSNICKKEKKNCNSKHLYK